MSLNVILTSSGSGGDVLPFLRLGSRLKSRGHDVTLISHCHYREMAGRSGLQFEPLDSPDEYAAFMQDGPLLNTPRGTLELFQRHTLPKVLREIAMIQGQFRRGKTVLVTRDLFDLGCRLAAEKFGVPALWVFMAPVQIAAGNLRLQLFRDILAPDINRLRTEIDLPPVSDWGSWLGGPARGIAFWPSWFAAQQEDWFSGVTRVGFPTGDDLFAEDLPGDTQELRNGGCSPVLITSGTGMYFGSEFYAASTMACKLLDLPAILVAPHASALPSRLPENVRWFPQLSFSKVMPRMSAVIHHGGIGTVAAALAAGVPQLVLAKGADRPSNALLVKQLGVADVELPPRWKPDAIAGTLRRLLVSAEVRERCELFARRLRDNDAIGAACEIIEGASCA
jgi:rhamnosyltransferase subunit B